MRPSKRDNRDLLMERAAGLRAIAPSISKRAELAGFLTLMHPEKSADEIAALALKMTEPD